jgi:hypothetical protein
MNFAEADANHVIVRSHNPHVKTPIPGKPSKSGLIGVDTKITYT